MNLVRFDPFRELESMSARLNKIFGSPLIRTEEPDGFGAWAPAIDVEETDKEFLVKADLPEVNQNDVKVGIEDGILSIEGERKQEKEEKGRKFHRVERMYGSFVRRFAVPSGVDQAKVAAEFKNGVLQIHLPKAAESKPKSISVKVT